MSLKERRYLEAENIKSNASKNGKLSLIPEAITLIKPRGDDSPLST